MNGEHQTLTDVLEDEVLTEMAGTFFGARKSLEDFGEVLRLQAEALRVRSARAHSRIRFLREILLGQEGEAAFFAALGLPPPFAEIPEGDEGLRPWRPDELPFAFSASARYAKLVFATYSEVRHDCDAYMNGELEADPSVRGRKRISPNYHLLEAQCATLNARIDKLNRDMPPSAVLQYARGISAAAEPGEGAITNVLGAESLDKGLLFQPVDFAAFELWRAPELPEPAACEKRLRVFCSGFFKRHAARLKGLLAELRS